MESDCFQCKKKNVTNIMEVLSCKHIICEHCYLRLIINTNFDSIRKINFSKEEPVLRYNCKCQTGEGALLLREYITILQKVIDGKLKYKCKDHPSSMGEIYCNKCHIWYCSSCFQDSLCRNHIEPNSITSKCVIHNYNDINMYCNNCKYSICRVCKELMHSNCKEITLYDNERKKNTINKCQYKSYEEIKEKLSQLHQKAIKSYKNMLKKKLKVFDELIKKIEDVKIEVKDKMENKKNQIMTIVQLLMLTYQNMYLDTEVDLNQIVTMKKKLNYFLYNIEITPEIDENLVQIINKIKSYTPISTFKYEFVFKKSKIIYFNELNIDNKKITSMASIGQDNVAIAISNCLRIYSCSKNKFSDNLFQHEGDINAIIVLSYNLIVTGSSDKSIRIWNLKDNVEVNRFLGHLGEVTTLCFINQGRFASAGNDSMIKIWNYENFKEELSLFDVDDQSIKSLVYLPNCRIASAGESEKINIWDFQKDEDKCVLYGHVDTITKLLLLKDKRLASCSLDTTIKIWKNNTCQISLEGHSGGILVIYQLKDNRLISGSMDQTCRIWDLFTNICEQELKAHNDYISSILELVGIIKEKGNLILTTGYDYILKIWK